MPATLREPAISTRGEWECTGVYLNTATYGLPPTSAHGALLSALEDWRTGRTSEDAWEECTERARAAFGRLVSVAPENIAIGATVSELIGLVAASLPDRSRVILADGDFASTVFPWLVHRERGLRIRSVPLDHLAESLDSDTAMVAFSHVQPASGDVADLPAVLAAAKSCGTLVCVDGTQACGWLPTDASAIDFYVCHAYKWLMSPRGAAFMTVSPQRLDRLRPLHAGWYATADPNNNLFGLSLRLSRNTGRRLDTSPAWFSWVGTIAALEVVERIGVHTIREHDMRLANRFAAGLGLPAARSAIVFADVADASNKLHRAGVRASVRGGRT
ncbi:MAG: aminotransferase class V-fold PLP-dependent enzyme, partial [Candidatus Eremiobacteraeota bacterium]|nr:aminotransferase class V-fold PLP-dependent enzyme [Candidatus Eremiobacteraeota bacterium]